MIGSEFTGSCNLVDLNGDGLPEAVVSNVFDGLSVLLNTARPPTSPVRLDFEESLSRLARELWSADIARQH